jgi:hypothetical protein
MRHGEEQASVARAVRHRLCWFAALQLLVFGPLKFSPVGHRGADHPGVAGIMALATWPAHWREPFEFGRRESVPLQSHVRKAGAG